VLPIFGSNDGMLCMELVGRGDPNRLDLRVSAKLTDAFVNVSTEARLEGFSGLRPKIRAADQFDLRQALQRRDEFRAAESQTCNSDF
jgi:hypothetical protein